MKCFFPSSPSLHHQGSQAATLWQIIYYFSENLQTVNPRHNIVGRFLSSRGGLYCSAFDCCVRWLCRARERKSENLASDQKVYDGNACIKNVAVSYAFPLCHFVFFLHGGSERENHHPDELPTRLSSPCGFTFRRPDSQVFAALSINNLEGAENIYVRQRCWGDLETRRKTS